MKGSDRSKSIVMTILLVLYINYYTHKSFCQKLSLYTMVVILFLFFKLLIKTTYFGPNIIIYIT